ncbi:hypothetical protein [Sulfidibacter corallicola]|uniref:Uncharacterized protein n=1 Tax=Sulfidibacter corallicola TaxID=2818388 RepID=A0A8A4TVG8_SULCO|nr:hypothetical protein [Sulfidibacter corallicola]QTD50525.1 hypothetical protein J3U87_33495 [Sulfidibacter corallicola]
MSPKCCDHKPKPHVKFECFDCGFTAYYSPNRAPHWFRAKLEAAGTHFPQERQDVMEQVITAVA